MDDLKTALKEKTLVFGTENAIKKLKNSSATKVFISSNCPENVRKRIEYYTKLGKIELVKLEIPNDEIGLICKKPFSISVLCY